MNSTRSLRILIGFLFIAMGALLLLRLAGVKVPFEIPSYIVSWQMILIVLGVFFLVSEGNRGTGLTLLIIGGIFLARDVFSVSLREIIMAAIPLIFIIAGIFLLFPRHFRKKKRYREKRDKEVTDTGRDLDVVHIFSGGSRRVQSEQFRGGEVVCIFGGADIHFSKSVLAHEENVLHVSCIFGGCDIYVPDDWTVRPEATTIFAGLSDKRFQPETGAKKDADKTLIIKGFLLFGGIELKSA